MIPVLPGSDAAPTPAVSRRLVVALWLGWYVTLMLFQQIVWARFTLQRPDYAYPWTGDMTHAYADGPRSGPWFYARWDSPRYVQIARAGYRSGGDVAAFYPVYPLLMRAVHAVIVHPLGLDGWQTDPPYAGWALAGLIVSAGMALLAALLMAALAADRQGAGDGPRAAFYLLIFPTALYLAQVYTEATYLAIALGALLALYRRHWALAAALMVAAALARAVGVFLVLPLIAVWLRDWWNGLRPPRGVLLGAVLPPLALLTWWRYLDSLGLSAAQAYASFSREILTVRGLLDFFGDLLYLLREPNAVQIALDLALALLAIALCLKELRREPGLALYGLAAVALPLSSGQLTSMSRYVLAVIPVFLVLARGGRRPAFDRVWTVISLAWFALNVVLYVHGFWLA